jgi:hypothetical protein
MWARGATVAFVFAQLMTQVEFQKWLDRFDTHASGVKTARLLAFFGATKVVP